MKCLATANGHASRGDGNEKIPLLGCRRNCPCEQIDGFYAFRAPATLIVFYAQSGDHHDAVSSICDVPHCARCVPFRDAWCES